MTNGWIFFSVMLSLTVLFLLSIGWWRARVAAANRWIRKGQTKRPDTIAPAVAWMLFGSVLVLLPASVSRCSDTSGDGTSDGIIVNVAHEGALWPMPALYLVHANEVKADAFGIDPTLVDRARAFARAGTRVQVRYQSSYVRWAWTAAHGDVITSIEPAAVAP